MQSIFTMVNRVGIPTIESVGVELNTGTSLVYTFRTGATVNSPFRGLLLVKLSAPPTGGTTEPVLFDSVNLTNNSGQNVTVSEITGGIYLCYYERGSTLRVLTGI